MELQNQSCLRPDIQGFQGSSAAASCEAREKIKKSSLQRVTSGLRFNNCNLNNTVEMSSSLGDRGSVCVSAADGARCESPLMPSVFGKAACQRAGRPCGGSAARPDRLDQTAEGRREVGRWEEGALLLREGFPPGAQLSYICPTYVRMEFVHLYYPVEMILTLTVGQESIQRSIM